MNYYGRIKHKYRMAENPYELREGKPQPEWAYPDAMSGYRYNYEFTMCEELDKFERKRTNDKIQISDQEFEERIKAFAAELARCTEYRNIDMLLKYDIAPGLVILDYDEYVKVIEEYDKNKNYENKIL